MLGWPAECECACGPGLAPGCQGREKSLDTTHPGRPRLSLPHLTAIPPEPEIAARLAVPRARIETDDQTVTFAGAGNEWTFALPVAPALSLLADGGPVTLAEPAAASDLTLGQAAEVVTALVAGQAVAVVGGSQ
ncbi:hypothetical protein [Streptomyces sp. NPDC090445]|uniref:hypothetical protein n=1 Tax=Streptomyces sp. NPDC090445 TaxID=3365963 RepID=UPI003828F61F